MTVSINGSGGITYPDGSTNSTRSVSTAGDTINGKLTIGAQAVQYPVSLELKETTTSASYRSAMLMGNWLIGQASSGGTRDYFVYDSSVSQLRFSIRPDGNVITPAQCAFSAYRQASADVTYAADQTVIMTSTKFNVGSAYNTTTGIFTAPVTGLYFFSWNCYNNSGTGNLRVALNTSAGGVALGQGQTAQFNQFSGSGVVVMTAGDTAWLRSVYANTVIFQESNHSVFTGYFLG